MGFASSPGSVLWGAQNPAPTYAGQVMSIVQQKCLACHSGAAKMGGLIMDSYDTLMKGGTHGPAIIPGKSEESRVIACRHIGDTIKMVSPPE